MNWQFAKKQMWNEIKKSSGQLKDDYSAKSSTHFIAQKYTDRDYNYIGIRWPNSFYVLERIGTFSRSTIFLPILPSQLLSTKWPCPWLSTWPWWSFWSSTPQREMADRRTPSRSIYFIAQKYTDRDYNYWNIGIHWPNCFYVSERIGTFSRSTIFRPIPPSQLLSTKWPCPWPSTWPWRPFWSSTPRRETADLRTPSRSFLSGPWECPKAICSRRTRSRRRSRRTACRTRRRSRPPRRRALFLRAKYNVGQLMQAILGLDPSAFLLARKHSFAANSKFMY